MRDRLIEMIAVAENDYYYNADELHEKGMAVEESSEEFIADYLLANGVIVPPCKVGDDVYRIGDNGKIYVDWQVAYIQVYEDEILYIDDSNNYFYEDDIGKTVFLTREEAVRALQKVGVEDA